MLNPDRDPGLALLTVLEGITESKINYSGRTWFGIRVRKPVVTMGTNHVETFIAKHKHCLR